MSAAVATIREIIFPLILTINVFSPLEETGKYKNENIHNAWSFVRRIPKTRIW